MWRDMSNVFNGRLSFGSPFLVGAVKTSFFFSTIFRALAMKMRWNFSWCKRFFAHMARQLTFLRMSRGFFFPVEFRRELLKRRRLKKRKKKLFLKKLR